MNRLTPSLMLTFAATLACQPFHTRAATITKADNALPLYDPASWVGNIAPTAADIALFDNNLVNNTSFSLGANLSWAGIQLTNPSNHISFLSDSYPLTLGSSGIDMSAATKNLTLNNLLNVTLVQTWNIATQLSVLSDFSIIPIDTTLIPKLTKSGSGTLSLGGTNVFSTAINIFGGTIKLLAPHAFDFRRIYFVTTNEDIYPDAIRFADSTNVLDLNGFDATAPNIVGPGIITNSGSSPATLTLPYFNTRTLPPPNITATIQDGTGGISLNRNLGGNTALNTVTITTQQTYTGSTTLHDGITILKFSPDLAGSPILSPQSHLILSGGSLRLTGDNAILYSQTFDGLSIAAGRSGIFTNLNGSLTLGNISRDVGGSVLFSISSTNANTAIYTTASNTPSGILGGWAVVNSTQSNTLSWAVIDNNHKIVPLDPSGYTSSTLGAASFAPTVNTDLVGHLNLATAAPNLHTGSLRVNPASTLTLNGVNVIDSGGILVNGTSSALITGGSLTSGNGKDLIIHNLATSAPTTAYFTIAAPIVDADGGATPIALVVNNQPQLKLTAPNTYSGGTYITSGLTRIYLELGASFGSGDIHLYHGNFGANSRIILADGVNLPNNIIAEDLIEIVGQPTPTFIDVAPGNSATLSGNFTADTYLNQYRMGTNGGTLVITGTHTSGNLSLTGGSRLTTLLGTGVIGPAGDPATHIIFAGNGSLIDNNGPIFLRLVNVLLKDNASLLVRGSPIFNLGLLMGTNYTVGSPRTESVVLTLQDSAIIDVGTHTFDLGATAPTIQTDLNLNGGSVTLGQFVKKIPDMHATLRLNGGTLRAALDTPDFFPDLPGTTALVQSGGAKINTNTHNITLAQSLTHDPALASTPDGGLTKLGPGTLTLASTANTFTGPLSIQQDTLALAHANALKINALTLAHTNSGSNATYTSTLQLNSSRVILQSLDSSNKPALILQLNEAIFAGKASTSGITSSTVALDPNHLTIGVYDNAALHSLTQSDQPRTNWAGGTGNVDTLSLLITPALKGDANLDGLIDIADMIVIANNWNLSGKQNGISTLDMAHGDVNADGIVDIADMVTIANNWNQTSTFNLSPNPEPTTQNSELFTQNSVPIPEPTSLAVFLPLLLMRRKLRLSSRGMLQRPIAP